MENKEIFSMYDAVFNDNFVPTAEDLRDKDDANANKTALKNNQARRSNVTTAQRRKDTIRAERRVKELCNKNISGMTGIADSGAIRSIPSKNKQFWNKIDRRDERKQGKAAVEVGLADYIEELNFKEFSDILDNLTA